MYLIEPAKREIHRWQGESALEKGKSGYERKGKRGGNGPTRPRFICDIVTLSEVHYAIKARQVSGVRA